MSKKNNKNRALYLLFSGKWSTAFYVYIVAKEEYEKAGYTLVYKHCFPSDEPPYIMVEYWGHGVYQGNICVEDGESVHHYLIRRKDVKEFIALMNERQTDYCDLMIEGNYTRAAGEHNLSMKEYADGAIGRPPRVKTLYELPHILSRLH